MKTSAVLSLLGAMMLGLCAAIPAGAQSAADATAAAAGYPARPVNLIVPFAPGGGNDILARSLGAALEARMGQAFVVMNKAGAGGNIGAHYVVRSAPDGYNLLLATNTLSINPAVMRQLPFDADKDLAPVALVASTPFVLVVNPALPVRSVSELTAYARANPGKLSYASTGVGTPHHLGMEMFKSMAGADLVHVPYKGSVPAMTAVAAGEAQVMFVTINAAASFIGAGRLRAIAVGEQSRLGNLPDVPTVAESGVPGFELSAWYGIFAPAGTPPAIIARLESQIDASLKDAKTADAIRAAGFELMPGPASRLKTLLRDDLNKWARTAAATGIQPE